MSTSIKEELQNVAKLPLGPRGQPASSSCITCPSSSWSKQYGKPYPCARSIACRRVAAERASGCASQPHLAADVSHRLCVKPPDGSLGPGWYEPCKPIQLHVLRRFRGGSRLRRVSSYTFDKRSRERHKCSGAYEDYPRFVESPDVSR